MLKINFSKTDVFFSNRIFSLKNQAVGVVKSEKFFPVFDIDNSKYVFKPLSRTKPLTTPLFAYAEVFWSNIINEFFMPAPIYRLAEISGYNVPKYYKYGTLVPYILGEEEKLVNLLEFFIDNPDPGVNIRDYENYCLVFYDYTDILASPKLAEYAEELSFQVLISILRADQNYHYENVSLKYGEKISVAEPIDHEFSTFFLFPDDNRLHEKFYYRYISSMLEGTLKNNMDFIKKNHPSVVAGFLASLEKFEEYLNSTQQLLEKSFDFPCSSSLYEAGIKRYKEMNEAEAEIIEANTELHSVDYAGMNEIIRTEILSSVKIIRKLLQPNEKAL